MEPNLKQAPDGVQCLDTKAGARVLYEFVGYVKDAMTRIRQLHSEMLRALNPKVPIDN